MIDIEAKVYDTLYTALIAYNSALDIAGTYVEAPAIFPHVSIVEMDNSAYERTATLGTIENHARVSYQIDIYSSKKDTAKSECKALAAVVDPQMSTMGFRRVSASQTPNIDRTIYRYTLRYEAIVAKGVTSGTNTKYVTYTD